MFRFGRDLLAEHVGDAGADLLEELRAIIGAETSPSRIGSPISMSTTPARMRERAARHDLARAADGDRHDVGARVDGQVEAALLELRELAVT